MIGSGQARPSVFLPARPIGRALGKPDRLARALMRKPGRLGHGHRPAETMSIAFDNRVTCSPSTAATVLDPAQCHVGVKPLGRRDDDRFRPSALDDRFLQVDEAGLSRRPVTPAQITRGLTAVGNAPRPVTSISNGSSHPCSRSRPGDLVQIMITDVSQKSQCQVKWHRRRPSASGISAPARLASERALLDRRRGWRSR